MAIPISGGEIINIASMFEGARSFIQAYGLQVLALLPLAHVSFLHKQYAEYKGTVNEGMFQSVVKSRSQLPPGAVVIKEYKDGEFMGAEHMTKSEGDNWAAAFHTDENTGMESLDGHMPYKGRFVPGTANLNREEAALMAEKLSKS